MVKKAKLIREVDALPEDAIENEVIFNKDDEGFYIGVKTSKGTITIMKKEVVKDGDNLEETGL